MSSWLSTQSANRYLSTYFSGFVDISGGQLILRNSDASFNGNLVVGNNLTITGSSTFVQDTTMNGNLTINTNLYTTPGPIKITSNTYTNAPLPSINLLYGYYTSSFASSNGTIYGISGTGPYNLLSSSNQGASWTSIITSATRIFGLSCSATGQYVIYLDATNVYLSSNYGSSFTNITSRFTGGYITNGPYSSFVSQSFMSNDGSTMFISGSVQPGSTMLFVSVNSGQTWNSVSPYAAYISDMVGYGTRVRISLSPDGNIFFLAAWYSQYTGYIMYINKSTLITNYTQFWSYFQYYTGGQNDYDPVSIASNYNGSYLYTIGTSRTSSTITQHTNFNTGSPSATQIRFDNITTGLTINSVAVSNDGTRVVVSVGNYYYISTNSAASFTRYPVGSTTSCAYISGDGLNAYFPTIAVVLYRYSISSNIQIINFGSNAPIMSGANIAAGTIPTSALSGGSSSYVDLTTNQTVGGTKTFTNLVGIGKNTVTSGYSLDISGNVFVNNRLTMSNGLISLKQDPNGTNKCYITTFDNDGYSPGMKFITTTISNNNLVASEVISLSFNAYGVNLKSGLIIDGIHALSNYALQVNGPLSVPSGYTIDFSNNAPIMSGTNIKVGTIPTNALNNGSGTFVDLTTNQTVGGVKTFSSAPVMSGASIAAGTIPANAVSGGLPYVDLSNNQTVGGVKTFSGNLIINGLVNYILDGNFTNYVTASTNAFTKVTTTTSTTPWYSYVSSTSNALYLINGYPTLDNSLGTFATYPLGVTKSVGIYTHGMYQELYVNQRFNLTPGTYQFSCYLCKTSLSSTNEVLYVYMLTYPAGGSVVSSSYTFPASVSDLSTNFIKYTCNFTIPTTQTYELYIGSLSRTGVTSNSMFIVASVSLTLNQSIQTLFQSTGTSIQIYSLQAINGISATSVQTIDFGTNAPIMSGANIAAGTIPANALSGVSGSYVDLTSPQTVGGAKTFSSLLTASSGLTVSGTVTLPGRSVADAALSTNVPLINGTNTFTGTSNTFNNIVTLSGGLTASASPQTINFGTNAPTMSGANVSSLNASNLSTGTISSTIISNSGIATTSSLSSYLTTSTAASTYATQSSLSSYLTTTTAASTYATQSSLSSYLTTSSAASSYVSIANDNLTISGVNKYSKPIAFGQSATSGITFGGTPSSTNLTGGVSSKIYDDGNLHLWTDDHFFIDVSGTCAYNGTPTSANKLYINKYGTYINYNPDKINGLLGTGYEFNVNGASLFTGGTTYFTHGAYFNGNYINKFYSSEAGSDLIQVQNYLNSNDYFFINSYGNIGYFYNDAIVWAITADGTTSGLVASSDRRLKENIEPLDSQWNNILSINPVSFDWKESKRADIGFIAQDIYAKYPSLIPPQFVSNNPNSTIEEPIDLSGNPIYYGMDYGKLTTFLWKGLQETMREIDSLKAENEQLKYLIHGLSQRISSLEYR